MISLLGLVVVAVMDRVRKDDLFLHQGEHQRDALPSAMIPVTFASQFPLINRREAL